MTARIGNALAAWAQGEPLPRHSFPEARAVEDSYQRIRQICERERLPTQHSALPADIAEQLCLDEDHAESPVGWSQHERAAAAPQAPTPHGRGASRASHGTPAPTMRRTAASANTRNTQPATTALGAHNYPTGTPTLNVVQQLFAAPASATLCRNGGTQERQDGDHGSSRVAGVPAIADQRDASGPNCGDPAIADPRDTNGPNGRDPGAPQAAPVPIEAETRLALGDDTATEFGRRDE